MRKSRENKRKNGKDFIAIANATVLLGVLNYYMLPPLFSDNVSGFLKLVLGLLLIGFHLLFLPPILIVLSNVWTTRNKK